jgi:hypothetical protein
MRLFEFTSEEDHEYGKQGRRPPALADVACAAAAVSLAVRVTSTTAVACAGGAITCTRS